MPALVIPTKREGVYLRRVTELEDAAWFLINRRFTHVLPPHKQGAPDYGTFQRLQSERRRESREYPDSLNMGIWDTKTFNRLAFIGYAALYPDAADKKSADIGCKIAEPYKKRGYATTALQALIEYAREERGIELIIGRLNPSNTASRALVAHMGFELAESRPGSMSFVLPKPSE